MQVTPYYWTAGMGKRELHTVPGQMQSWQQDPCLGRSCLWEGAVTGQPPPTLSSSYPRTMAHLYCDPEWSQKDLHGPISHIREHLAKSKMRAFSPEHLASYRRELQLRASQGLPTTAVDLWALLLEFALHGQVLRLRGKPPRKVEGRSLEGRGTH